VARRVQGAASVDAAAREATVMVVIEQAGQGHFQSRSTKLLVHGGVRYLKRGNGYSLVLEALKERGLLYANARRIWCIIWPSIPRPQLVGGPFMASA